MTKKHYEQAARIVAAQIDLPIQRRRLLADAFAMLFAHNNPRFDAGRFLIACGLAAAPPKLAAERTAPKPRRLTGDPFSID